MNSHHNSLDQHLAPPAPLSAFPRAPPHYHRHPMPRPVPSSTSVAIEAMLDAIEDHAHALAEYIHLVHGGNAQNVMGSHLTKRIAIASMQLSRLIAPIPLSQPQSPATVLMEHPSAAVFLPRAPPGYVRVPVYRVNPATARLAIPPTRPFTFSRATEQCSNPSPDPRPSSLAPSDVAVVDTPSSASFTASQSPPPTPLHSLPDQVHDDEVSSRAPSLSPRRGDSLGHDSQRQRLPPLAAVLGNYLNTATSATFPLRLTAPVFKRKSKPRPPPLQTLASYLAIGPQRHEAFGLHEGQVSR